MDPSSLVPTADTIPVPWGWFKALLLLTFLLHLILMNLMLGGGLLAFFRRVRGGEVPAEAKSLPVLIALTINFGVPPLLFVQVLWGQFLYSSSVMMATFWILVVPILIGAYYAAYGFVNQTKKGKELGTVWLGLSTLLMLWIGFMVSNNMTLMLRPERWGAYFDHVGGGFLNLSEPTLFPRYLHFIDASLAVAGLGRSIYGWVLQRRRNKSQAPAIRSGLRVFAISTMVQLVIGILFWITLPGRIGSLFLGGSIPHTAHLWLGILLGLGAIWFALRGKLWLTTWTTLLVLVLMILVRDMVRTAYLEPVFHVRELAVTSQASPLVGFLISFVVVGAFIAYMVREAWKVRT